jgi:phenylalanyl-tRNA synthetase alpha chain
MNDAIEQIVNEAIEKIRNADLIALENLKIQYLGKKSVLMQILKSLSQCSIEEKKMIGTQANKAKIIIEETMENRKIFLKKTFFNERIQKEKLDYSKSFYFPFPKGNFHPVIEIIQSVTTIFRSLGFFVTATPEMETDWYNFEALNIPKDHPARDIQDTFYIDEMKNLLRTHTSSGQIRIMEKYQPPIKIILPGRVYRNEASDATHSSTFHQIEGFAVDENITFIDLKAILMDFMCRFFGTDKLGVRFRPSYFQFTEPSAEVDIQCMFCKGKGCTICKKSGWIEILGCGMLHPNVLKAVKYDPEKYTGYAFGMGAERITMLKYKIDDIRLFYENDLQFLKQF